MKICICGSLAFIETMDEMRKQLEEMGHEVQMPPLLVDDGDGGQISVLERYKRYKEAGQNDAVWDLRERAMRDHNKKIVWSDAVLIANEDKNGISGYIGANTLLEMGLAFHLQKPIYLMNDIPEISYKEEIFGIQPMVIHRDLTKIGA